MTEYVMLRNHVACNGKLTVWVPMPIETVMYVRIAKQARYAGS
jgi:hypothetical protein